MTHLGEIALLSLVTGFGVCLLWDMIADRIQRRKNKALSDERREKGDCSQCKWISRGFLDFTPLWTCQGCEDAEKNLKTNPNEKGSTMTEGQNTTPVQPPETPLETKMNQSLTKAAEDLPYDLIGQKVRCWSHHQTNQCIEGRVSALSAWGVRLKAMEGKEFFVAWSAGPIVQILEY